MEITTYRWTHVSTLFLLWEYQKRQKKFRNSKWKKKDLWQEISTAFQECLNILVSADAVDKKFRNMKQSYLQIKKKMNTVGHATTTWEYFEAFQEIFTLDERISVGSTISSTPVKPSCSYSSSSLEAASNLSLNENDNSMEKSIIQSSSTSRCKRLGNGRESTNKIERQTLQTLNKISEALKERNVIFKDFVETYKKNSKKNKT